MYAVVEEKKICTVCGCSFLWRGRWKDNWPEVKYCGERCARRRLSSFDLEVEETILLLLNQQAPGATITPHEVSQHLERSGWQSIEEATLMSARRLAQQGKVEEARKYLTDALQIFERLGTLLEPDKVRKELADLPAAG